MRGNPKGSDPHNSEVNPLGVASLLGLHIFMVIVWTIIRMSSPEVDTIKVKRQRLHKIPIITKPFSKELFGRGELSDICFRYVEMLIKFIFN
jgi:hypothetical protein